MKKVAIITINSLNFGNRLQNYALQETLKDLGFEVETIRRNNYVWDETKLKDKVLDAIRYICKTRKGLYLRFDKSRIKFSRLYAGANEYDENIPQEYDFFITGSDQVWNPYYEHLVGQTDLLTFAPHRKKISYAASFGVSAIPEEKKTLYKSALKDYKAISVRETDAVRIVRDVVGENADLVLDPTLLLTKNDWVKIEREPEGFHNKRYILVYLLGEKSLNAEKEIRKFELTYNAKAFNVLQKNEHGKEPRIGPAEFLWLVHHAEFIITDSFHATAFSLMYHKSVRIIQREGIDMSSRIYSLFSLVGLEIGDNINQGITVDVPDYIDKFEEALKENREKSIEYLRKALCE